MSDRAPPATDTRKDALDPLPYVAEWPSLRSAWGAIDIHSLAAFWVQETELEGHYLDFGPAAGRSAVAAIRASRRSSPRRIHRSFLFGVAVEEARTALETHGVAVDADVVLCPGGLEAALPAFDPAQLGGRPAAIVHVGADAGTALAQVLAFVRPYLQPGAIVLLDDGARGFRAWVRANPSLRFESYARYGLGGEAFLVDF
jgi:hypothetical protein